MTGKRYAVTDNDVLIANGVVHACVCADHGILEEDAVLNKSALTNLNTAEEDAVFNSALDHATVRNERILRHSTFVIVGGGGVADLCENRSCFHFLSQKIRKGIN